MRRLLLRGSRVVLHSVVGGVLLVAGLVMLLTPGPGIVVVVLGLAVLAREFRWADRLKAAVTLRIRDASTAARARLALHRGGRDDTVADLPRRPDLEPHDGGAPHEAGPSGDAGTAGEVRPAS